MLPSVMALLLLVSSICMNQFSENHYAGVLTVGIFIIIYAAFSLLKTQTIKLSKLDITYWLLTIYSIARFYFSTNTSGYLQAITLILGGLLFLIIENANLKFKHVSWGFLIYATIQSTIVILQALNILPKVKEYYIANGLMGNPNAVSLTLFIPLLCIFYLLKSKTNKLSKTTLISSLLVILVAIIILQCRTVWVVVIIGWVVFHHKTIRILINKFTFVQKLLLYSLVLISIGVGSYALCIFKPESTTGRILIWKNSVELAVQKPLFGIGLGNFSKEYNLKQAEYFKQNKGSKQEIRAASYTNI